MLQHSPGTEVIFFIMAYWFLPYHRERKQFSPRRLYQVNITRYAADTRQPLFILISQNGPKITTTGWFYHSCYCSLFWFCSELSMHITDMIWQICSHSAIDFPFQNMMFILLYWSKYKYCTSHITQPATNLHLYRIIWVERRNWWYCLYMSCQVSCKVCSLHFTENHGMTDVKI
jgi:hypothetical protein